MREERDRTKSLDFGKYFGAIILTGLVTCISGSIALLLQISGDGMKRNVLNKEQSQVDSTYGLDIKTTPSGVGEVFSF